MRTKLFQIPNAHFDDDNPVDITLDAVPTLAVYTCVNTVVKVLFVPNPTMVAWKQQQEVTVCDQIGQVIITLWENDINKFALNASYNLKHIVIKEFASRKHLGLTRNDSIIEEKEDIGNIPSVSTMQETDTNITLSELALSLS